MTDYAMTLGLLYPGSEWTISGNDYSTLVWLSDSSKPTKKTLDEAWPQVQYELEYERVQDARAARYRAEADPLYFEAQRDEDGVTMADWQAKVAEIKADLPYPQEP